MNTFIFSGFLGQEPETKTFTNSDGSVAMMANFSVGVTRKYKNKEGKYDTDWFRCSCTGKQAEFVSKYFHKGMKADCVGRVEINQGTNREGQTVTYTNVRVTEIEFGERQSVAQANMGGNPAPNTYSQPNPGMMPNNYTPGAPMGSQQQRQANTMPNAFNPADFTDPITEDLPFN